MSDLEHNYIKAEVSFKLAELPDLHIGGAPQKLKALSVGLSLGAQYPMIRATVAGNIPDPGQAPILLGLSDHDGADLHLDDSQGLPCAHQQGDTLLRMTGDSPFENTKLLRWIQHLNDRLIERLQ